jgi:hypothetical protein
MLRARASIDTDMRELAHERLDTQDTGYVLLVRINESLAAFGQKESSAQRTRPRCWSCTSHTGFLFDFFPLVLKVGKARSGLMVLRYLTLELYT